MRDLGHGITQGELEDTSKDPLLDVEHHKRNKIKNKEAAWPEAFARRDQRLTKG